MSAISASRTSSKRALATSLLSASASAAAGSEFSASTSTTSSSSSQAGTAGAGVPPITTAVARARASADAAAAKRCRAYRAIDTLPDTTTENGAPAFSTSGDARLDLFFSGFVRNSSREKLVPMLHAAWRQSPEDTVRLILQSRDARAGKGERACSLIAWLWLRRFAPVTYCLNLPRFLEVGYFKDLLSIVVEVERDDTMPRLGDREVLELEVMADYLLTDVETLALTAPTTTTTTTSRDSGSDGDGDGKMAAATTTTTRAPRVTLVGKWVPTEGTHFDKKENGGLARRLARLAFGATDPKCYSKTYRKSVSALRKHLVVVERLMCAKQWAQIEFGKCPSQCHNRNKKAFIKHCGERYEQYITRVKTGADKICTAGLQPHELVQQCMSTQLGFNRDEAATLALETVEAQWTQLIATLRKSGVLTSALSVVDVSGSMSGVPMQVAIALGLVVADLTDGAFHNRLLTFSASPQWHLVEEGATLQSKVKSLQSADWGMNTDLLKVFTMILDVAVKNKVAAADLPKTLFIFSDMQFDAAQSVRGGRGGSSGTWDTTHRTVTKMYAAAGYTPPSIVYWNLQGKAKTFPVDQYAENVACVAGFSAELLKLFLKGVDMSPLAVLQSAIASYEVDIEESER